MNCHHLMYKHYRVETPYEKFIKKYKEQEEKEKKEQVYGEIIKFRESRYPLEFLKQLEDQINPFELSLQKLKELFSSKHPEYSNELVNESVEHIFNRKCQESEMIKESTMVIEYGEEYIRNGRKLIKEDFSFDFNQHKDKEGQDNGVGGGKVQSDPLTASKSKRDSPLTESMADKDSGLPLSSAKKDISQSPLPHSTENQTDRLPDTKNLEQTEGDLTDRNLTDRLEGSAGRSPIQLVRVQSQVRPNEPSKIIDMMKRTERFNELLDEEIRRDKQRFENLEEIMENSPDDSIFYRPADYTDRSKFNESLPSFRESDLIVRADSLDTGRSEVEELNFLLSSLNHQEGTDRGGALETRRSKKSQSTLRLNRQIKEQLYTARGTLKIDLVRKAVERLKKEASEGKI